MYLHICTMFICAHYTYSRIEEANKKERKRYRGLFSAPTTTSTVPATTTSGAAGDNDDTSDGSSG